MSAAATTTDRPGVGLTTPGDLRWTPHPLLPVPTDFAIANILAKQDGAQALAEYYVEREKLIKLSESDPFNYGTEPDHWKDADQLLYLDILILIVFGGNRAGKTEWAAKRVVEAAMKYDETTIFCLHENETGSIILQQKVIWKYLPPQVKLLNKVGSAVHKINYSLANGFSDRKLVLPNRTEILFLTYHQKPGDFEGVELGSRQEGSVGAWGDENLTLPWLNMLKLRLASRSGKLIWTYTPVNGITPTIKEVLGSTATTSESRYAELLGDRVNVPGLPVGHMPYIQLPFMAKARVIYFHSILNPFGKHYENIKTFCVGKPSEYIERRAYGYSRDVAQRAFPYFGPWNIVPASQIPATGTNYMFVDPAGSRNWATVWVRVTPGNPPKYYIYRDWPQEQRYGEWAVATEREITADAKRGWDGDPGPAQTSLGYGIVQYKRMFLREESVVSGQWSVAATDQALLTTDSPPLTTNSGPPAEVIHARYIDSRAGKNQHAADKGGTCLVDELQREQRNPNTGEVEGPSMTFRLASGVDLQEGITQVNTLLFWNKEEKLIPQFNEPRLYVSEACRQVTWALTNYTGMGGETGACKDFVDLMRYMAMARLRHVDGEAVAVMGGGSY